MKPPSEEKTPVIDVSKNTQSEFKKDPKENIDENKQTQSVFADDTTDVISDINGAASKAEESIRREIETGKETIDKKWNEVKQRFESFKKELEKLESDILNNKSVDLLIKSYTNQAKNHRNTEIFFQIFCASSIIVAIIFLYCSEVIPIGDSSLKLNNLLLKTATITSLLLFLARWCARISYRHGLESKRLHQYALDLSTMPAYFSQALLNDDDQDFKNFGKRIIYDKSGKLFGNIERFNEQHSHGFMELIFKYLDRNQNEPVVPSDELEKSEEPKDEKVAKQASVNSGSKSPTIDTKSP